MTNIRILPATLDDARHIGAHLRPHDRVEIEAANGRGCDHIALVVDSFAMSRWCNTVSIDGVPAVIYGVSTCTQNPRWGVPWLVATKAARRLRREFVTESEREIDLMLSHYGYLHNVVHKDNTPALRWLTWLGFRVNYRRPVGEGRAFFTFNMGNPHV